MDGALVGGASLDAGSFVPLVTMPRQPSRELGGRRLVAVVGPTGAGKTELAITLALRFGGEVVNADSRQVYRGMDVGTAKPTRSQRERAPHRLFDLVDPDESYSLALYLRDARSTIQSMHERSALPIVVGGTGSTSGVSWRDGRRLRLHPFRAQTGTGEAG